jgi:hypothetical protein
LLDIGQRGHTFTAPTLGGEELNALRPGVQRVRVFLR